MAEPGWATVIVAFGGIALGAALQWMQAADQARRERRRERERLVVEFRKQWIERRERLYLDSAASVRRQLDSYLHTIYPVFDPRRQEPPPVDFDPSVQWRRSPEMLSEWGRLLTEVEFFGSDGVRDALNSVDLKLRILELAKFDDGKDSPLSTAEAAYVEAVAKMRLDLGLSEGRTAQMRSSFGFLNVNLDQPQAHGKDADGPPPRDVASRQPSP